MCLLLVVQSRCNQFHRSGPAEGEISSLVSMGLMHNYVIQCTRVRLGGIAKQVPPFFRECVFHFYILATNIPL